MSERIDHAATANAQVRTTLESLMAGTVDEANAHAAFAMAQVHATLALVEQQRIANLIAWTTGAGYLPSEAIVTEVQTAMGLS